jgi:hypothetical protein
MATCQLSLHTLRDTLLPIQKRPRHRLSWIGDLSRRLNKVSEDECCVMLVVRHWAGGKLQLTKNGGVGSD